MTFVSSNRNHENCRYEGSPLQGPYGARRGRNIFLSPEVVGNSLSIEKMECHRSAAGALRRGRRHIS